MEFNDYFYYFICMSADIIYLTWLLRGLINLDMFKQILYFCSIYFFMTLFCLIGYFYLGENYGSDLGLEQLNAPKWARADIIAIFSAVGVFLAPIAVIIGFHEWKRQKKLVARIDALEKYKNFVADYNKELISYQMSSYWYNLQYGNSKVNKEKLNEFRVNANKVVITLFHEVMNKKIYFLEKELDNFETHINNFYIIYKNLDKADLIVESIAFKIPRPCVDSEDNLQVYKNLYLLDPSCQHIKSSCSKEEMKILDEFSKVQIHNYLNGFSDYIDDLLLKAYR